MILSNQVIDKSFGFDTAVEEAQRAINAAHVEAESVENGVGIVKLMGRYSGKCHSLTISELWGDRMKLKWRKYCNEFFYFFNLQFACYSKNSNLFCNLDMAFQVPTCGHKASPFPPGRPGINPWPRQLV